MRKLRLPLLILVLAVGLFFALAPRMVENSMNRVLPHAPTPITPEGAALHADLTVGDLHTDSTLWRRDLTERSERGHVDLPRLRAGNVALQVFTSVTRTPAGLNYESNSTDARDNITLLALAQRWPPQTWGSLTERALYQGGRIAAIADAEPETLMLLRGSADVARLLEQRDAGAQTVGALLGIEGAHALNGDLASIDRLYGAGFRMFGLHHFFDNALGGSLHGTGGEGLSDFGKAVVQRLEERGAIIDVAHSSPQSVRDVLALTTRPLVVSHTGFQGHCPTPRNIDDALMREIAAAGGLIGVGFWDAAVCDVSPAGIAAAIRYGVALVGEDHIALGSDYDGATTVPFDVSELAVLTDTLLQAGMAESTIRKVMGGNLSRFLTENLPQ
ncbi:dipeptidase [Chromatocurvus halotolerans]|uniref:Microsomal dipeptidase-like Zn-dependent dipeptidase n=1 Tax=Chromatocurvus halotolerans TaxID=1132028 RepID=A0A4R2KR14_9GAMM|nr:dipeptidase [Chromatocurvus halotolerans]TCO76721.1 microsomal dipeptidase-like Zn-dependent dipeptidase [Chromatocurvus halotolerans]